MTKITKGHHLSISVRQPWEQGGATAAMGKFPEAHGRAALAFPAFRPSHHDDDVRPSVCPSVFCPSGLNLLTDCQHDMSAYPPHSPTGHSSPPSLADILANAAPPPWTLSAFTAYLSQNHCLETLEFTMDADRYQTAYNTIFELDEAVAIVYELMNDSVLVPFLESVVASPYQELAQPEELPQSRQARGRIRIPKDSPFSHSAHEPTSRSPIAGLLPMWSGNRNSEHGYHWPISWSTGQSTEHIEREGALSEDTGSAASPGCEPVTPPTTPPAADWAWVNSCHIPSPSSPAGFQQRDTGTRTSGWKKMGAKLGLGRMGKKRSNPSNVTSDGAGPSELALGRGNGSGSGLSIGNTSINLL
ncbi:hypothetical protein P8C59_005918 [Phyllachora maydis]|uniref:RGS domain-containing protein n=1 Tax=Phyllachora maydis TaxID=1825666 RepID=A0AAD9I6F1_9PEZI|nr:hypothetical protein P8C59_005918 [Phyllachora maydis]